MFKKLKTIGPGAIVAAAFIGPGTVTTATIAGAGYGYTLLWAILFSILATISLQEMAARLGLVGGLGLGEALRQKITAPLLKIIASTLVIGAILIGNAAYEAGNITGAVLGFEAYMTHFSEWSVNPMILMLGALAFVLLFSGKYKLIERFLILMVSIMGLIFLMAAFLLQPDMHQIVKGLFTPTVPEGSLVFVIGIIGTTVVPYNLFLHAAVVKKRWNSKQNLWDSRWDTVISVTLGGIITMAILVTSAVAFEGQHRIINNAADLSKGLIPLLGSWSSVFIAIGFLAAGLSSTITAPLAAAFATSEIMGWPSDLKARNFRLIWLFVLLIGIVFSSLGFKPTLVILFAQVANGLLLPVIAIFLLWIVNDEKIMGAHTNTRLINLFGFIVIAVTLVIGVKGILSATNFL